VRALLFLLALTACRRSPAPIVKEDPVSKPVDAAAPFADDPFLIHGKVVDLKTLRIAHALVKEPPYEELALDGVAFLSVRGAGVEAFDLATGKRRFSSTVKCARLTKWRAGVACANNDALYVIDANGDVKTNKAHGPILAFVPLTSTILVRRLAGEADIHGSDGAFLQSHPRIDTFDGVFPDKDGYCIAKSFFDFEAECRKADGTVRLKKALPYPLPPSPVRSFFSESIGDLLAIHGHAATTSATVVVRITEAKQIAHVTPQADRLVLDGTGDLVLLLRRDPFELLDLSGKSLWKLGANHHADRALLREDTLFVADDVYVAAVRRKDGSTLWEQKLDPIVVDGGYAHITTSIELRGSLLLLRSRVGTAGTTTGSRLRIFDVGTGKQVFADTM
jgi:hypothetical protein